MTLVENIIEDRNEKRKVLVFTTKKQANFIERCYGEGKIRIATIEEEMLEKYLEEKRKQEMK